MSTGVGMSECCLSGKVHEGRNGTAYTPHSWTLLCYDTLHISESCVSGQCPSVLIARRIKSYTLAAGLSGIEGLNKLVQNGTLQSYDPIQIWQDLTCFLGTPTGKVEQIGGLKTYIAAPKDGSTAKSIIFLVDSMPLVLQPAKNILTSASLWMGI